MDRQDDWRVEEYDPAYFEDQWQKQWNETCSTTIHGLVGWGLVCLVFLGGIFVTIRKIVAGG